MKTQRRIILNSRRDIFIVLYLMISVLAVYIQVRDFRFVIFDDNAYVAENLHVHKGIGLDTIKWAFGFKEKKTMYWHPLTWMSHMLDVQVYGLDPGKHHLVNVILHILNSILLFVVFRKMTGEIWKSAFVALVFAIHPLNVESVAWIASRKTVLSVFLGMLTIFFYIKYTEHRSIKTYILTLMIFSMGLMAKPMLVTLPSILLLLDIWPIGRFPIIRHCNFNFNNKKTQPLFVLFEKIPFIIISLFAFYFAAVSMKQSHIFHTFESIPLSLRIENAIVSYGVYLRKAFLPLRLAVFYPFPKTIDMWKWMSCGLLLLCMSIVSINFIKKKPYLFVGWFWFLGTMIPMSGIIQAGLWPAMADRWAYFPLIGIFVIIAWLLSDVCEKRRCYKEILAVMILSISFLFTFKTWNQVRYWQDSFTLFNHTLKITKNNSIAHNSLGTLYAMNDMIDKAVKHFKEANKIDPNDITISYNLGRAYMIKGRIDDAINNYRKILIVAPEEVEATKRLAEAYASKHDWAHSILYVKKWIQLQPKNPYPYYYMSKIYARSNNKKEALLWLDKSVEKGFNQWKMLKRDKYFDGIRETEYYKKLIH